MTKFNDERYSEFLKFLTSCIGDRSLREFCKQAGVYPSTLSRILQKKDFPGKLTMERISKILLPKDAENLNNLLEASIVTIPEQFNQSKINLIVTDDINFANAIKESLKSGDLKHFKGKVRFVKI